MEHHQQAVPPQGESYYAPQEKAPGFVDQQHHQQGAYAPQQGAEYQQQYQNGAAPPSHFPQTDSGYTAATAPPPSSAVLGMKRAVFFGLIAAIAVLLLAVIGLGAGLGVSQQNLHNAQASLANAQASVSAAGNSGSSSGTNTATATTSSSQSTTKTSSAANPTATLDKFSTCPKANNTVYTSNADSKKFLVHCGIDYGKGGADDLSNVHTFSMTSCMDACAETDKCEGAGWGFISGDSGNNHTCWMKTNMTASHNATSDWLFAVLES